MSRLRTGRRPPLPALLVVLAVTGLLAVGSVVPGAGAAAATADPSVTTPSTPTTSTPIPPTVTTPVAPSVPPAPSSTALPSPPPSPTAAPGPDEGAGAPGPAGAEAGEPPEAFASTAGPGVDPEVTIRNLDAHGKQMLRFDTDGHAVDAHDGLIAQFTHEGETRYWWYGTVKDCGLGWLRTRFIRTTDPSPWCGFSSYSSDDLETWRFEGHIARGDDPRWSEICGWASCWRPKVVHDPTTGLYVAWANTLLPPSGYSAWTAPTPGGPWSFAGHPEVATNEGLVSPYGLWNQDVSLFVDDDGTGYVILTDAHDYSPVVERLEPGLLGSTGETARVPVSAVEAPSVVRRGDRYFMFLGSPNRGFGHTAATYYWADDMLGPWHEGEVLSPDSFGGQPTHSARWRTTDGRDLYVFQSDLWRRRRFPTSWGYRNQGLAGFSVTPIAFDADGRPSLPAAPEWREQLRFVDDGIEPEALEHSAHEPDPAGGWYQSCDVRAGTRRSFTFVAPRSGTVDELRVNVVRSEYPDDDGHLELIDEARPDDVLAEAAIPRTGPGWTARAYRWRPDVVVTAGRTYRVVLRSANTNTDFSCFGFVHRASGDAQGSAAVAHEGGAWTGTGEVARFSLSITDGLDAGAVANGAPHRLLDATVTPYGTLVPVAGEADVPPTGVRAAWVNVTVDGPAADGRLDVHPADGPMSSVASLRYEAGDVRAFPMLVRLSASGELRVTSSTAARVVVDVTGWVLEGASEPGRLTVLPEAVRAVDTRVDGTSPRARSRVTVALADAAVPADATAVLVNVTGAAPTAATYLSAFPTGTPWDGTSTLNLVAGEVARSNRVLVQVGDGPEGPSIDVLNHAGTTGVVVDVVGYVAPRGGARGRVGILAPVEGSSAATPAPGVRRHSLAVGAFHPASGRTAPGGVVVQAANADPPHAGYLTVWGEGTPRPRTSDLNHPAGTGRTSNVSVVGLAGPMAVDTYANTPGGSRSVALVGFVT